MTRVAALEFKTQFMSADSAAMSTIFSGCNLFVNNDSGNTASIVSNAAGEGLGNLIVGYNSTGHRLGNDVRTGSHNLIVGDDNNYSSYGGIAAGRFATISGIYASVLGGYGNTASGDTATVSGGDSNTASGRNAAVSGGIRNTASGNWASVSGGQYGNAPGVSASISGGDSRYQSHDAGWSGGSYHSP